MSSNVNYLKGEIFRAYHVGGYVHEWDSESIGSGQTISHNTSASLGGVVGDVEFGINNTNVVYLRRDFTAPPIWHMRTYIDFDGMSMTAGDWFEMIYLRDASLHGVSIRPYHVSGAPRYRIVVSSDDHGAAAADVGTLVFTSNDQAIPSGEHRIDLLVYQETADGANDGVVKWFVDGSLVTTVTGVDNFTRWSVVDHIRVGGVTGIDAGTTGTLIMGKFIIRHDSQDIPAQDANEILHIMHPSGNELTQWDTSATTGSNAQAYDTTKALGGIPGDLKLTLDTTAATTVYKGATFGALGASPETLAIDFYLDWSELTMATSDQFHLLFINGTYSLLKWHRAASAFNIVMSRYDDAGHVGNTFVEISNSITQARFTLIITKASTDVASDATFVLNMDGEEIASGTGLDLYDNFETWAGLLLGVAGGKEAGTTGTLYLGKVRMRNDNVGIPALYIPSGDVPLGLIESAVLHSFLQTQDIVPIGLVETGGVSVTFEIVTVSASSAEGIGLETTAQTQVLIASSRSEPLGLQETSAVTIALSAAVSESCGVTESTQVLLTVTVVDAPGLGLSETVTVFVTIGNVTDTLTLGLGESAALLLPVTGSDSVPFSLTTDTDVTFIIGENLVFKSASSSVQIQLTESASDPLHVGPYTDPGGLPIDWDQTVIRPDTYRMVRRDGFLFAGDDE